jgi:hypothetical protein
VSRPLQAPDKPHSKFSHVYAIVRFDLNSSGTNGATVVKVMSSRDLAEQETARLNNVNAEKHCIYEVQTSRFIADPGS